ncbi:MAG: catechol 2,3-dioxygenase-like lactoylglutathione lyase family enzyme, partial [Candidatus Nitrosomirales archaeon]
MLFRKVASVILLVSDMRRSIDFYKNTLGLPLKNSSSDWAEF